MAVILRFSKTLPSGAAWLRGTALEESRPFLVRHYLGPGDALSWIQVQQEALAGQRGGRSRTMADFHRLWLAQSWWQPDRLMFACLRGSPSEDGKTDGIVGTIGFRPVPPVTARLFWLAVRPTWQGRGVGRLLVAAVERQCVTLGIRRLELETLPDWSKAIAFYQSLGFSTD